MREPDLEQLAQKLGARRAARVDGGRVADRVVARLASGEGLPRRLPRWTHWGLAAAAAIAVAVATVPIPRHNGSARTAVPVALSELDADGLDEALDSLVTQAPVSEFAGGGIGTMTTDELESLLAAMEG